MLRKKQAITFKFSSTVAVVDLTVRPQIYHRIWIGDRVEERLREATINSLVILVITLYGLMQTFNVMESRSKKEISEKQGNF